MISFHGATGRCWPWSLFSGGEIEAQEARAFGQGHMRVADPAKDQKVPKQQEPNDYDPQSNGDDAPGKILLFILENKAALCF